MFIIGIEVALKIKDLNPSDFRAQVSCIKVISYFLISVQNGGVCVKHQPAMFSSLIL